jgi:glyoxylase-like metal-dependent hydrolase (beta-lactamase superfamily II)
MQVTPGVFQVNGTPYGRAQNGYYVAAHGAKVLIDSGDMTQYNVGIADFGARPCLPEIEATMAQWGHSIDEVTHLFATHAHLDHAGHAAELQRRGVKIVASSDAAERIASGDARCIGHAHNVTFETCVPDIILDDGETLKVGDLEITAIATPGHAEGHVIFDAVVDGYHNWFVGDLFQTKYMHGTVQLPWNGDVEFDRRKYVDSVTRIQGRPVDHVLPGHGPVCINHGKPLIELLYTMTLTEWA